MATDPKINTKDDSAKKTQLGWLSPAMIAELQQNLTQAPPAPTSTPEPAPASTPSKTAPTVSTPSPNQQPTLQQPSVAQPIIVNLSGASINDMPAHQDDLYSAHTIVPKRVYENSCVEIGDVICTWDEATT